MAAANAQLLMLSDAERQTLEKWLLDFESSWAEGKLDARFGYLPAAPHPLRLPALIEMVKIDLKMQWKHGSRPLLESYLHAYPELGTPDTVAPDLLQAEYEVRHQFGDAVSLEDYARRFPQRMVKLRQLLAQVQAHMGQAAAPRRTHETMAVAPATQPPPPPSAPKELPEQFGRYRIVRKLGGGGMGTVYLAEDTRLLRRVALKVPHLSASDGPEMLERMRREAQAAAALTHPNVCPVYDTGEADGIPFFTMAYIEGRPLSDILADSIKANKPLPQRWCASVSAKVAQGIQAAHKLGILHRDLKPANIMIRKDEAGKTRDDPVVMDFGLARRKQDTRLTGGGMVLGTLPYMPPEMVLGPGTEPKKSGDLYSLGVILYELLTGRLPFQAEGVAVAVQIATEEAPRPSSLRSDLDPRLEAICLKAMAKRPEERFGSMEEMARALAEYLRAPSVPSTPAPATGPKPVVPVEKVRPSLSVEKPAATKQRQPSAVSEICRRRWPLVAAAGAVAFGLLLLGIIIVIKYRGSDGKTTELSIEVGKTPEPSRGGATAPGGEAGTKPPVGLPARYKNSMGMEFALVPKGKFWMGGTGSNLDKAKEVEVPYDFYLGVYEVTQEEWQKVTGRNPSAFRGSGDARHAVKGLPDEEFKRFPVEQVSWDDAQLFLEVLNARAKESGWKYRLPKEAEWEYACRGGPASHKINYAFDFYLEKPSNELRPDQANFERNMNRTCKVGSYLPNQLGLYDMHGNVAEWCDDGENVAVGPSRRVLRGGYYRVEAFRCRAASRFLLPPATREAAQGLRLARIPSDLPGTATAPP